MSNFSVEEFLRPINTAPTTAEQKEAIDAARVDLDRLWPHLPVALARRTAELLQLRERIHNEEIRSL